MSRTRPDRARATLWASAFVIGALVIVQAGRLPANPAYGEVASQRDAYTLLTCGSGRGGDEAPDEVLYLLDSRTQVLMVYEVDDARARRINLRDARSLDQMFAALRQ